MKQFEQVCTEDRRFFILKTLALSGNFKADEYIMREFLPAHGYEPSQDVLRSDFAWLAEQGLVDLELVAGVQMVTLTERGMDVQAGRARVPGIRRPRPGE